MSREDPQLRIRLPIELKEKIEESSKERRRSMNAEIVSRLEHSFIEEIPFSELPTVQEAIKIVNKAKDELSKIVYEKTYTEIINKVRLGHTTFHIDLNDLELDGLSDDDFEAVFKLTFDSLKENGYEIPDATWDVSGFMVIIPQEFHKST
ncbi:TPA: Arc family DNA-binding protein [Citrobacter amalonaticus]|jgi:polynucleotide 5'-kinase involved in rRNA processing|nr:Arc family DNA-binding protein [Citrobacter amalonaticus]